MPGGKSLRDITPRQRRVGGLSWTDFLYSIVHACTLCLLCHTKELQGTPRHWSKPKCFVKEAVTHIASSLQFRAAAADLSSSRNRTPLTVTSSESINQNHKTETV